MYEYGSCPKRDPFYISTKMSQLRPILQLFASRKHNYLKTKLFIGLMRCTYMCLIFFWYVKNVHIDK